MLYSPVAHLNCKKPENEIEYDGGKKKNKVYARMFVSLVRKSKKRVVSFQNPEKYHSPHQDQHTLRTGHIFPEIHERFDHGSTLKTPLIYDSI